MGESTLEWTLKATDRLWDPRNPPYDIDSSHSLPFLLTSIYSLELGIYLYSLPLFSQNPRLVHAHHIYQANGTPCLLILQAPNDCEHIGRRGVKLLLGHSNG